MAVWYITNNNYGMIRQYNKGYYYEMNNNKNEVCPQNINNSYQKYTVIMEVKLDIDGTTPFFWRK